MMLATVFVTLAPGRASLFHSLTYCCSSFIVGRELATWASSFSLGWFITLMSSQPQNAVYSLRTVSSWSSSLNSNPSPVPPLFFWSFAVIVAKTSIFTWPERVRHEKWDEVENKNDSLKFRLQRIPAYRGKKKFLRLETNLSTRDQRLFIVVI